LHPTRILQNLGSTFGFVSVHIGKLSTFLISHSLVNRHFCMSQHIAQRRKQMDLNCFQALTNPFLYVSTLHNQKKADRSGLLSSLHQSLKSETQYILEHSNSTCHLSETIILYMHLTDLKTT